VGQPPAQMGSNGGLVDAEQFAGFHAGPPERHDEQHTDALRLAQVGQRRDEGRLDVGDRCMLDRVGDPHRPPRLARCCLSDPVQIPGRVGQLTDTIPVLPAVSQRLGSSVRPDLRALRRDQPRTHPGAVSDGERFEAHDQQEPRQTKNRDSRTQILPTASLGATTLLPLMDEVRSHADALEAEVADNYWPLPKYREMLFIE